MNMNPIDLNCFARLSDEERQELIAFLHSELVEADTNNIPLRTGIETVLQGLGAEGYEFT